MPPDRSSGGQPNSLPDSRTVESGRGKKRSGSRGRKRQLETAVRERHDIRNERNPLARRHMPKAEQHIAPDELPARDWTRETRVKEVTKDVELAYRLKRGESE